MKIIGEQRGTEIDAINIAKETPLHCAARRGDKRMVRYLLEKDVLYEIESESGTAVQV